MTNVNTNETNVATTTNDDVTNETNDDATTTQTTFRATTRAIRDIENSTIKFDSSKREQTIRLKNRSIKIVKTNNDTFRVDHSLCNHSNDSQIAKRDRAKCRDEMKNFIASKIKNA